MTETRAFARALIAAVARVALLAAGVAHAASDPAPSGTSGTSGGSTPPPPPSVIRIGPRTVAQTPGMIVVQTGPGGVLTELAQDPSRSKRPAAPLTSAQLERLRNAQGFRDAGQLDRARTLLLQLLTETPHHPVVLGELARVHLAKNDFNAVAQLGRSERAATKDSILLGPELTLALERMSKHREAAQVALEVWATSPSDGDWAEESVIRLSAGDPKGVREAMRKTAEALPDRLDLTRGYARLEWKLGDEKGAFKTLAVSDRPGLRPPIHWSFAEELLTNANARDSLGAIDAFLALAGDQRHEMTYRGMAARRAYELSDARGDGKTVAPKLLEALKDVPRAHWSPDLLVGVARGLRQAGMTNEARALLEARGTGDPTVMLERALTDLRDGAGHEALASLRAVAESSPEATFRYAEALLYAGLSDSSLVWYQRSAENPTGLYAGAALERIYLIEDARPKEALPAYGRLAYREWRGDTKGALTLADSLYHALPRTTLWAQTAIVLSAKREAAGDWNGALEPVLALADSLPGDRLAPLARQRAGDLWLTRLKDERKALEQYEACLTKYPRAWNAAEVRRRVEALRRDRRF